jgi:hypothetical protein
MIIAQRFSAGKAGRETRKPVKRATDAVIQQPLEMRLLDRVTSVVRFADYGSTTALIPALKRWATFNHPLQGLSFWLYSLFNHSLQNRKTF